MVETLQSIWIRLKSLLGLDSGEMASPLPPFLESIFNDPLYLILSLAALFGLPYGIYKISKAAQEKDQKLDELMEEMEEMERGGRWPEMGDTQDAKPLFPHEEPLEFEPAPLNQRAEIEALEAELAAETEKEPRVEGLGFHEKDAMEGVPPIYGSQPVQEEKPSPAEAETTKPETRAEEIEEQAIVDLQAEMEDAIDKLSSELEKDKLKELDPGFGAATPYEPEKAETPPDTLAEGTDEPVKETEEDLPAEEQEEPVAPMAESAPSPEPVREPVREPEKPASDKKETMIHRLESLQENLEAGLQSSDTVPEKKTEPVTPKPETPGRRIVQPFDLGTRKQQEKPEKDKGDRELESLESFIFMAHQRRGH